MDIVFSTFAIAYYYFYLYKYDKRNQGYEIIIPTSIIIVFILFFFVDPFYCFSGHVTPFCLYDPYSNFPRPLLIINLHLLSCSASDRCYLCLGLFRPKKLSLLSYLSFSHGTAGCRLALAFLIFCCGVKPFSLSLIIGCPEGMLLVEPSMYSPTRHV